MRCGWGFAIIVIVTTFKAVVLSASNFQIVLGTDNVMQWWFLATAPLAFILMAARVIENFSEDYSNFRNDRPLLQQNRYRGRCVMTDASVITLISLGVTVLFMLGVPVFLVIAAWVVGCSACAGSYAR